VIEEEYEPSGYQIKPGCPAPNIVVIKDFIRSYVRTVKGTGRLSQNKTATVRTALSCAERFFGGFEEATGSKIVQEDRSEIYSVCRFYSPESQCPNLVEVDKKNLDRRG
jgi:hypothetical protein